MSGPFFSGTGDRLGQGGVEQVGLWMGVITLATTGQSTTGAKKKREEGNQRRLA